MLLPITLSSCAAAGIICIWLGWRIGQLRGQLKISVGDGGNEALLRRMRAQANFVEYTPFVLLLIAGIELAGKGGVWLPYVAGVFILGRVGHVLGMDGGSLGMGRNLGILVTMLTLLGLSVFAALIAAGTA